MAATEFAVPARLPPLASVLASSEAGPAVWAMPLGAGTIVTSGALDTWRYRGADDRAFAKFWVRTVAQAAETAAPAVTIVVPRASRPGAAVDVQVVVRDAALSDASVMSPSVDARAVVTRADGTGREVLRLWPGAERGVFATSWTPATAGTYRIDADAATATGAAIGTASAEIVTGEPAVLAPHDARAWTHARGGTVLSGTPVAVAEAITGRVTQDRPLAPTHPMRSPWWLGVFVAVLGGEWWLRRRAGLR